MGFGPFNKPWKVLLGRLINVTITNGIEIDRTLYRGDGNYIVCAQYRVRLRSWQHHETIRIALAQLIWDLQAVVHAASVVSIAIDGRQYEILWACNELGIPPPGGEQ